MGQDVEIPRCKQRKSKRYKTTPSKKVAFLAVLAVLAVMPLVLYAHVKHPFDRTLVSIKKGDVSN
jgi:hypothetical protein